MRHCGLPTRLLDWTESFTVALYFAIKDATDSNEPCIYILNPFELNLHTCNKQQLLNTRDLGLDYYEKFIEKKIVPFDGALAICPIKQGRRVFAQKSVFTFHGSDKPIEKLYPTLVKRFDIPKEIIPDACDFLELSDANEYSLFPDFDGLGRFLAERYSI